ncbi:hypothetical protein PQ689_05940 [Thermoanaerobacterium thermosaccharolyticum]|nr:hypothetical protein [Thermoanaerobacterium sp. CMT5567-10]WLY85452.1 hypothetical protein Q2T46_15640 [Thermoanaerobacterium sp. CMT5567-10]
MNNKPEYLHGEHLIDRAGYNKFKEMILEDIKLNLEAMVAQRVLWAETKYRFNFNLKSITQH